MLKKNFEICLHNVCKITVHKIKESCQGIDPYRFYKYLVLESPLHQNKSWLFVLENKLIHLKLKDCQDKASGKIASNIFIDMISRAQ
jgi:hypothetical protein